MGHSAGACDFAPAVSLCPFLNQLSFVLSCGVTQTMMLGCWLCHETQRLGDVDESLTVWAEAEKGL